MNRAIIALAVLAGTMLAARPGYSQYASYVGVPSVSYSNIGTGGYMSNAPFYNSYSSFTSDVGITNGPVQGAVAPQVIVISQGGYGSFVGGVSGAGSQTGASVLYFPTYQPFIPSTFLGIESFRPWAIYTRYSPF